jgi:hypothetical protein
LGDKAYIGEAKFVCPFKPATSRVQEEFNSKHHAQRQNIERMNKRIKIFGCLKKAWRHELKFHEIIFSVICQVTNLSLVFEPL